MRPITRQGTCLASRSRLSHNRNRRRPFHTSHYLASESRSPNPSSDSTETSSHYRHEREEDKAKQEDVSEEHQSAAVNNYAEDKAINENRRTSFRKSARHKRISEVPKPPPIPQWFLKHNVRLVTRSDELELAGLETQVVRCTDLSGRETLFEFPYYVRPEIRDTVERKYVWDKEKIREVKGKKEYNDVQLGSSEESDSSDLQHTTNTNVPLTRDFFNHKIEVRTHHRSEDSKGGTTSTFIPPSSAADTNLRRHLPLSWSLLEAEASIRAAFALSEINNNSSSFAASRVDLSLQCVDPDSHSDLDDFVRVLARNVGADMVRLDANDFAELTADYIGHGRDEPGSFANLGYDVFEGYHSTAAGPARSPQQPEPEENEEDEYDEDEEDEDEGDPRQQGRKIPVATFGGNFQDLTRFLQGRGGIVDQLRGQIVGVGVGASPPVFIPQKSSKPGDSAQSQDFNRDDAKLTALLELIMDAAIYRRSSPLAVMDEQESVRKSDTFSAELPENRWLKIPQSHPRIWLPATAQMLLDYLAQSLSLNPGYGLEGSTNLANTGHNTRTSSRSTIIHIRDLADICNLRLGNDIVDCLVRIAQKRRRTGERIVIVGTTTQDVAGPFAIPGEAAEDQPFRAINIPALSSISRLSDEIPKLPENPFSDLENSMKWDLSSRIAEINLRHLQGMLRRLQPENEADLFSSAAKAQLRLPYAKALSERVLSFDQVQRLVLTAIGLSRGQARSSVVTPLHLSLANAVTFSSDEGSYRLARLRKLRGELSKELAEAAKLKQGAMTGESPLERIRKACNPHETRLLSGVVDPQNIKTGFKDVHATPETIEALKTLTTLSLLRPDAFKYGVLANDRLSGLLLYGPPGTGKTLLAKAVAKESKATVMEVSGAQIYEKYVGEGEKMVRAVFSLAKRLSPCVVFLDEADAIFGSRSNAANRVTHREIINQFLREWDGMDDHGVFVMVATNRPFDLDDAVLRRLPRRLLVDLPVAQDRESILGIHLRNEWLDSSVSLPRLAEQTPLYSGSDLKNLAVAAALAAVREENSKKQADPEFQLPERRKLTDQHFEKALTEISASISEDMSTLNAIRKFDEQYGDRRGRRKKAGYGFGSNEGAVDEAAARVRHTAMPPPGADSGAQPGPSTPSGP